MVKGIVRVRITKKGKAKHLLLWVIRQYVCLSKKILTLHFYTYVTLLSPVVLDRVRVSWTPVRYFGRDCKGLESRKRRDFRVRYETDTLKIVINNR